MKGKIVRRSFLKGVLSAGGFAAMPFASAAESDAGQENLRIGILADLHLSGKSGAAKKLERAFRIFRRERVDGVLICGDLTHNGLVPQLEELALIWNRVFPGNKGEDGIHVEKLFHYGDHDTSGHCHGGKPASTTKLTVHGKCTEEGLEETVIAPQRKEVWERIFGEPWAPVVHKNVKGYDFILSQYTAEGHNRALGLEEFMKGFSPDPCKPFFYSQHRVLRNTVQGPGAWGQDDGSAKKILAGYPNCCAFVGHAHRSAIGEDSIWQGPFTAVQVPSLSCVTQERDHANKPNGWLAQQGLILSVCQNSMTIRRLDLVHDADLAPMWTIPFEWGKKPFDFEARRRSAVRPEFPAGAKLDAKIETHCGNDGGRQRVLQLQFPVVNGLSGGVRAYDYEVTVDAVCFGGDAQRIVRRYFSPKIHFAPIADKGSMKISFKLDEFAVWNALKSRKWGFVHVAVRPRETFGAVGAALEADVM